MRPAAPAPPEARGPEAPASARREPDLDAPGHPRLPCASAPGLPAPAASPRPRPSSDACACAPPVRSSERPGASATVRSTNSCAPLRPTRASGQAGGLAQRLHDAPDRVEHLARVRGGRMRPPARYIGTHTSSVSDWGAERQPRGRWGDSIGLPLYFSPDSIPSADVARATGWGLFMASLVLAGIYFGSRRLRDFDAALVRYAGARVFSAFGLGYRFSMWLTKPPTRFFCRRGWRLVLRAVARLHKLVAPCRAASR